MIMKKNFLYQWANQLLISVLPFIISPYIARVLGAEQIGIYSYTFAIVNYFVILANLGIINYGNRRIAQVRNNQEALNRTFSSLYALHISLSVITLLGYAIYICCFVTQYHIIVWIQAFYLIATLLDISWFYYGIEKFKITVLRNTVIKVLTVICVFFFVHEKQDLWKYTAIMAMGTMLSQTVIWLYLRRYVSFVHSTWGEIKEHIKPMFLLFAATVAVTILSYTDQLMLGIMSTMSELGYYSNAHKLMEFPIGFVTVLGTVMIPRMANIFIKGDIKRAENYIGQSMHFAMIMSFALALGIAAVAPEFAVVFWGEDFAYSGTLMPYLSFTMIIIAWNSIVRTQYLIPKERDKAYLISIICGALFNVIFNLILIPALGAVGAAIGTIIGYMIINIVQTIAVWGELPLLTYIKSCQAYFFIGFAMYWIIRAIGILMGVHIITVVVETIVGAVFYVGFSLLYAYVKKDIPVLNIILKILIRLNLKRPTTALRRKLDDQRN